MRPSYASLCSVSIFFFRETWQTFLQCFSHHQLVNGFDCWKFVVNASRISQSYFALWGQRIFHWVWLCEQSLFFLLGLPPSFLVFRGFAAQRSRARALPLLNMKKKRDCSQSRQNVIHVCTTFRLWTSFSTSFSTETFQSVFFMFFLFPSPQFWVILLQVKFSGW